MKSCLNTIQNPQSKIPNGMVIALLLLNYIGYPVVAVAQSNNPVNSSLQFTPPPPPSGDAPTGRPRGGASRGNCPEVKISLTALVPSVVAQAKKNITNVWGLTVDEHPTFWFYYPYDKGCISQIEFSLQDNEENDVYRSAIALPEKPGVIAVLLPATAPALAVGKNYRWFFKIYYRTALPEPPQFVNGTIQRVNPNPTLSNQLKTATPQQQLGLYANNGIWFNALTTLAELRLKSPQDTQLADDWKSLLQSVGLGDVAAEPLIKREDGR
jgi:hypothetical protein